VDKVNCIISQSAKIRESLVKIDLNSIGMVFIYDENDRIVGVATDGDIRSCLLDNFTLEDSTRRFLILTLYGEGILIVVSQFLSYLTLR